MDALLLCAGLGTRLRPLTEERPKPLVPVLDRPLAAFAIDHLAAAGVRRVVANAHHLAEQIEPALSPLCSARGASLTVLREATLLGTGGAIRNALAHLGEEFVVFNGDVLARPDLAQAMAAHRSLGARVTMVLRDDPRASALGAIELDAGGRVRRILDEGPPAAVPTRRCVFTGVYVVSSSIADDLPAEGCVVRHTLRRLLARGEVVAGVLDDGPWFDLGTLESYAAVNFAAGHCGRASRRWWRGHAVVPVGSSRPSGGRVDRGRCSGRGWCSGRARGSSLWGRASLDASGGVARG
jgi:mannose-1-phosphate guanylyltransferase